MNEFDNLILVKASTQMDQYALETFRKLNYYSTFFRKLIMHSFIWLQIAEYHQFVAFILLQLSLDL